MNNILVIANQFPPMGGSGVQRTSKFVKYMPLFGYSPVVLTRDDKNLPIRDDSLTSDFTDTSRVIRTKAYDFTNLTGIMRIPGKAFARLLLIPDSEVIWASKSYNRALDAIKEYRIKAVYSTSYPYSGHLLALKIKRNNPQIKWVADFRDEWTNNPYTLDNPHNKFRTSWEKKMESRVLSEADALISNTPVMVKNFIDINGLKGDNFHCIPNGYDEEDFTDIPKKTGTNSKFTVTYTGALYGRRKPDTFFEALKQLINQGSLLGKEIEVNLIGNFITNRLQGDIDRFGLTGVVNIMPYMPHKDCLKRLALSDCLLLIEGQGPGAEAFYTGKVFEYMMAKVPVLAVIPEKGAAAGLVKETNIGVVAEFNDISAIKQGIMHFYSMWRNDKTDYAPLYEVIAGFERKELTRRLCHIFDGLIGT